MNRNTELEIWNTLASDYSDWISGRTSERGKLLHDALLRGIRDVCPQSASSVIDIGCGDGRVLRELFLDSAVEDVGVDGSSKMLSQAKLALPRLKAIEAALDSQIPIPSATADLVLCTMVLMYFEDIQPVMHEVERIVVRDGTVIIAVPHPCYFNRRGALEAFFDYWKPKRYAKRLIQ